MNLTRITTGAFLALLLSGFIAPVGADEAAENWEKTVFHVDEVANARWALMLARSYLDDNPGARVVFVTYGPGIDFLLQGAKDRRDQPFAPAVLALVERGVSFRVCAATLSARDIPRDDVLDAAAIVPSGIAEITRLQLKEAYAYFKP
jgi:intracellular sulfur oxidation DsrE/DsrF family protein